MVQKLILLQLKFIMNETKKLKRRMEEKVNNAIKRSAA